MISTFIGELFKTALSFVKGKMVYVYLAIGISLITIVSFAYWHYNNLVNEVATLRTDKAQLQVSVKTQQETIGKALSTIDEWKASQKQMTATLDAMMKASEDANKDVKRLSNIFAKHNLTELSSKKPKLIENAINSGTNDAMRLLICTSGDKGCDDGSGKTR